MLIRIDLKSFPGNKILSKLNKKRIKRKMLMTATNASLTYLKTLRNSPLLRLSLQLARLRSSLRVALRNRHLQSAAINTSVTSDLVVGMLPQRSHRTKNQRKAALSTRRLALSLSRKLALMRCSNSTHLRLPHPTSSSKTSMIMSSTKSSFKLSEVAILLHLPLAA